MFLVNSSPFFIWMMNKTPNMIDHGFPLASQREHNGFGKTPDTATPKQKWPV
ncbi:MAG: hypothetical protein ACJAWI_003058 [Marinomonas primoryensis]|jgi:hypothetical protein